MKNLYTYARECLAELNAIDIHPNTISAWKVSRAVRFWGQCSYMTRSRSYTIKISQTLLDDDAPVKALKETILHELIQRLTVALTTATSGRLLSAKLIRPTDTTFDRPTVMKKRVLKKTLWTHSISTT